MTPAMFSLEGKTALITGAASGIGAAIAETFARAGARVFVTDCNEAAGRALVERFNAAADSATFLTLDVTNETQCAGVARQALATAGHLDILVNNAGIGHVGTMATTTGADFDPILAVNTRGVSNVTRAFLPSMRDRQHGVIVNVASIAGM